MVTKKKIRTKKTEDSKRKKREPKKVKTKVSEKTSSKKKEVKESLILPQQSFSEKFKKNTFVYYSFVVICILLIGFGLGDLIGTGISYVKNKQAEALFIEEEKAQENELVGQQAPDFTVEDTEGNTYSLSDFKDDKPILLSLESTTCGWCAEQAPALEQLFQNYKDELVVMTVFSGEEEEALDSYISTHEITHLFGNDTDQTVFSQYQLRGTPRLIFIDKQGVIQKVNNGFVPLETLEEFVQTIL